MNLRGWSGLVYPGRKQVEIRVSSSEASMVLYVRTMDKQACVVASEH